MNSIAKVSKGFWLTLLYPFAGIIYTFRNIQKKESEYSFFLICVYFGLAFIYMSLTGMMGDGADSERYALALIEAHSMKSISLSDYLVFRQRDDLYANILLYLVSRFTANPQFFYGIVATIFGLFFAKTSWIVINETENKKYVWLFIVVMLLCAPIWKINGVRWWTALYVFLYGLFSFLKGKKWKIIWCLLSIYIHFTFLFPLYVVLLYLILPKKKILPYVLIFAFLSVTSSLDLSSFSNFVSRILPNSYDSELVTGYLTFEYSALHNFFAESGRYVSMYLNLYMALVTYFLCGREIQANNKMRRLFILVLLLSSLCLIINFAPWGRRFLDLSNYLFFSFFSIFLSQELANEKLLKYFRIAIPFIVYFALFQLNSGLYVIGAKNLFAGNFFTVFFYKDFVPIHYYIDSFLSLL